MTINHPLFDEDVDWFLTVSAEGVAFWEDVMKHKHGDDDHARGLCCWRTAIVEWVQAKRVLPNTLLAWCIEEAARARCKTERESEFQTTDLVLTFISDLSAFHPFGWSFIGAFMTEITSSAWRSGYPCFRIENENKSSWYGLHFMPTAIVIAELASNAHLSECARVGAHHQDHALFACLYGSIDKLRRTERFAFALLPLATLEQLTIKRWDEIVLQGPSIFWALSVLHGKGHERITTIASMAANHGRYLADALVCIEAGFQNLGNDAAKMVSQVMSFVTSLHGEALARCFTVNAADPLTEQSLQTIIRLTKKKTIENYGMGSFVCC